jgi:hypothetical protein
VLQSPPQETFFCGTTLWHRTVTDFGGRSTLVWQSQVGMCSTPLGVTDFGGASSAIHYSHTRYVTSFHPPGFAVFLPPPAAFHILVTARTQRTPPQLLRRPVMHLRELSKNYNFHVNDRFRPVATAPRLRHAPMLDCMSICSHDPMSLDFWSQTGSGSHLP